MKLYYVSQKLWPISLTDGRTDYPTDGNSDGWRPPITTDGRVDFRTDGNKGDYSAHSDTEPSVDSTDFRRVVKWESNTSPANVSGLNN